MESVVIVGGGISGVTCAESLAFLAPAEKATLITSSSFVKKITNVIPLGKHLEQFEVSERSAAELSHPNLVVLRDVVQEVQPLTKTLLLRSGAELKYKKLCLCTGAKPKLISSNDRVLGIRDTESVSKFSEKLRGCRRVILVGNGGIATELAHELRGLEVTWVIKDSHISASFVDPGAAAFFLDDECTSSESENPVKRMRYKISRGSVSGVGPSLGPDWHEQIPLESGFSQEKSLAVEYGCEVAEVLEGDECWPVRARLTNGKTLGCDLIVSATGVVPDSGMKGLEKLKKGADGGFLVDWKMETSEPGIFAAGDVCSAGWELARHWFQMRLWTQAHQMGRYVAKSMAAILKNETFYQDFCFEFFTHVTRFFGRKVVLLGLYNGQKLGRDYEVLLRVTKGLEYVKVVMVDGKMQGAVLIGDTDLEEMCENLILNQLDLSVYGADLLDPDIDVEDYFD